MSTAAGTLNKQINNYLEVLNTRQKKALLTVAKTFAEEQADNDFYSDEFKAELDKRQEEYNNGGKVITRVAMDKRIKKILSKAK